TCAGLAVALLPLQVDALPRPIVRGLAGPPAMPPQHPPSLAPGVGSMGGTAHGDVTIAARSKNPATYRNKTTPMETLKSLAYVGDKEAEAAGMEERDVMASEERAKLLVPLP